MSKQQTKGYHAENFTHVTPELLARVAAVVADRQVRRFSSSLIYAAHNAVFKLRETPQTCATCLVTRATNLSKWYDWQAKEAAGSTAPEAPVATSAVQFTDAERDEVYAEILDQTGEAFNPQVYAEMLQNRLDNGDDEDPAMRVKLLNLRDHLQEQEVVPNIGKEAAPQSVPVTGGAPDSVPVDTKISVTPAEVAAALDTDNSTSATQIILQKVQKDDYSKTDGDPFYANYTPGEEEGKGHAVNAETGKAVAPGTYATEDTTKVLTVAIGGKATYKSLQA